MGRKKRNVEFDRPRIGLIIKFVRQKRFITQKELTQRCPVSQTTLSLLEGGSHRASSMNAEIVLRALSLSPLLLSEKGLLDSMDNSDLLFALKKDLGVAADSLLKVYCAIFDAYSAMLPPGVIARMERMAGRNADTQLSFYVAGDVIVDILRALPYGDVKEIFSSRLNKEVDFDGAEGYEDALLSNAVLFGDPFLTFVSKAKVPYVDYFDTLTKIALSFDNIKFAALHRFDSAIDNLINDLQDYKYHIRKKML